MKKLTIRLIDIEPQQEAITLERAISCAMSFIKKDRADAESIKVVAENDGGFFVYNMPKMTDGVAYVYMPKQ